MPGRGNNTPDEYPKNYNRCPVCNSDKRFFEMLTKEAKEAGAALPNFEMSFQVVNNAAVDARIAKTLKPGTAVTAFSVKTDICLQCGCVYATFINKGTAKISIPTATKVPKMVDLRGLPMNNSATS